MLPNTVTSTVTVNVNAANATAVPYGTTCTSPPLPTAILPAAPATDKPITIITGPITTGGSSLCTASKPRQRMTAAKTKYIKPAANRPNMVAPTPQFCLAAIIGAIKAKDEPKKMGTLRLVSNWNTSVPIPAPNNANAGFSPVKIGTKTIAPNATNKICAPATAVFICCNMLLLPSSLFKRRGL